MLDTLNAAAVRTWCHLALDALGQAREEIDAINVYPVPDADTGTNLYLTVESAVQAVDAVFTAHEAMAAPGAAGEDHPTATHAATSPSGAASEPALTDSPPARETSEVDPPSTGPELADVIHAMAHGALIGARGNSGVILAQLLRGMSEVLATSAPPARAAQPRPAEALCRALRQAAASAYQAVARPVEGTMLTVAAAAAAAAQQAPPSVSAVAHAAYQGARTALAHTPNQLEALARAGVVDAGGRGLVAVLGALADAVSGDSPMGPLAFAEPQPPSGVMTHACPDHDPHALPGGPSFEVVYLLEAPDSAISALRDRLDTLGDSLVVVGGDGLWNIHVHVHDAGAAVEAGIEAGRPHRVRITHFGTALAPDAAQPPGRGARAVRAVAAVVHGAGLARLYEQAGATVLLAAAEQPPASGDLAEAVRRAHAREVVLLPNDGELRFAAGVAVERARQDGIRAALIPTRSAVQGIAALAVHEPGRRFDEDVVAMTAAAGATRYAELTIAVSQSWTMAGVCQAGDVLGLIDGDVAVIGDSLMYTAQAVLDRMLASGGEMVTLVLGAGTPKELGTALETHVREHHLAVDTVVYTGGQQTSPLLIGVE